MKPESGSHTVISCLLHSPNIVDNKRVVCFAVVRSAGQVFKVAPYGEPGSTTGVERPPLWRHMAAPVVQEGLNKQNVIQGSSSFIYNFSNLNERWKDKLINTVIISPDFLIF